MSGSKQKFEAIIPKTEAAAFFTAIGEGLACGCIRIPGIEADLAGLKSFKISAKDLGQALHVKLKLKQDKELLSRLGAEAVAEVEPGAESDLAESGAVVPGGAVAEVPGAEFETPKYKSVKKRMKKPWQTIKEQLAAGVLPERALAEAFTADCRLMLAQPGKGDERYAEFETFLTAFADGVEEGDLPKAQAAAAELERIKKECHERYK